MAETREAHLTWCRQRALEYVNAAEPIQAFASMTSDLRKHPETASLLTIEMLKRGQQAAVDGNDEVREWINGIR